MLRVYNGVHRNFCKPNSYFGLITIYPFRSSSSGRQTLNKLIESLMPHDRKKLLALRRQREKIKGSVKRNPSATVVMQVLGSGARGSTGCLYVSTDHKKYLFNCGESTQRLAYEHRLKLAKLEHIFLTGPTWKNMGGLPGMALTLQDVGIPRLQIHGLPGWIDVFNAVERFVILKDLQINEAICTPDQDFEDSEMRIKYVFLTKKSSEESANDSDEDIVDDGTDYYAYEENENGKQTLSKPADGRKIAKLTSLRNKKRVQGTLAYICKLHSKQPFLLIEKCVEYGVPTGPLLAELKSGKDITLENGNIVRSQDVCSPPEPGPVFIVVECPSEDYLDSLMNSEAFTEHQSTEDMENIATCVVHFTPENILRHPRYEEWMKKFHSTTRHIIINGSNKCKGIEAAHRYQHQLHMLHPQIFPLLDTEGSTINKTSGIKNINDQIARMEAEENSIKTDETQVQATAEEIPLITRAKTLDAFHLRDPQHKLGLDTSARIVLKPRFYVEEKLAIDGFLDALAEAQTEISAREKSLTDKSEYPQLVILGTGSCMPTKVRNTSGILLRIDENRSIIMDCGEGTTGQLVRLYGAEEADKILSTLKAIYISHLHADHHIGLISLLQARSRVVKEPVLLLAPEQIGTYLIIYDKLFEPLRKSWELLPNRDFFVKETSTELSVAKQSQIQTALGNVQIVTTFVKHCVQAFGIAITFDNGYKVVYSGDTMPSSGLVKIGADCDLLIHEATMDDELEQEAKSKRHSTVSQAIDVGERMNAKFTLLTHFSQRYSTLPRLPENENAFGGISKVGIAYDYMRVPISQLSLLPLFYPALKIMFGEQDEKPVKRRVNRAL